MSFNLTKDFLENLYQAIARDDKQAITNQLEDLHYADIAEILDQMDPDKSRYIYFTLDEEVQADVLMELEEEVRERFLSSLSSKEMADQLENLDSDDAADILGELSEEKIQEVISQMEDDEAVEDRRHCRPFELRRRHRRWFDAKRIHSSQIRLAGESLFGRIAQTSRRRRKSIHHLCGGRPK
jgi:Mg/Co/Ni transporter MgtE